MVVGPAGVTLGRSRQCDVVLDDPNVSRQHAEIRPRGGSWVLTDLGSTNGSRSTAARIDGPEVVKPGDEIELGTVGDQVRAGVADSRDARARLGRL